MMPPSYRITNGYTVPVLSKDHAKNGAPVKARIKNIALTTGIAAALLVSAGALYNRH